MFRDLNMQRYFSQVGARKTQFDSSGGSTSVPPTSFAETSSIRLDDGGVATPIINVDTMSIEFVSRPREYAASNPRYVVESAVVTKHLCETNDLVCNQPRSKRRSNPVVNLITPQCLGVPQRLGVPRPPGVVDLSTSIVSSIIELNNDNRLPNLPETDEQEEEDADVVAWIASQKDTIDAKKSYQATRHFQETWLAKLPWAECVKGPNGLFDFVKCTICRYVIV
jgi:hypothetical protein